MSDATKGGQFLRTLLAEILCKQAETVAAYSDNHSAQKVIANNVHHKRTTHIDVRHHFIPLNMA